MKRWMMFISMLLITAVIAISVIDHSPEAVIAMDEKQLQQSNTETALPDNAIALFIGSPIAIINNRELPVDPANLQVVPLIQNSKTLVPLRFIAEALGAKVDWNMEASTVSVSAGGNVISMIPGSNKIKINETESNLDVSIQIINDRTFVPLRVIAEALNQEVFYDRGLIIVSRKESRMDKSKDSDKIDSLISRLNNVPAVGSFENLQNILQQMGLLNNSYGEFNKAEAARGAVADTGVSKSVQASAAAPSSPAATGSASAPAGNASAASSNSGNTAPGYSDTNLQVQGVDEADIVKTDGEYIYQVNKQRIAVIKAYPAEDLTVSSIAAFEDKRFNPEELYLDGSNIVVIGNSYREADPMPLPEPKTVPPSGAQSMQKSAPLLMPYRYTGVTTTKVVILDASDKSNLRKIREVEIEGSYLSSRKIGSCLYLISNKNVPYYLLRSGLDKSTDNTSPENALSVSFRDTAAGDSLNTLDYRNIRYFPGCVEPNYMVVAGLNLDQMDEQVKLTAYLGSGQNIYVSQQNLYVSVNNYYNTGILKDSGVSSNGNASNTAKAITGTAIARPALLPRYGNETLVYKFGLNKGNITYLAKGTVPGSILNQFSMDEYDGNFRIATTKGYEWGTGENVSKNNVYVLDEMMNLKGSLEGIAPGEKIYSVRFMGEKGYVVTFKKVDPLFVLDLKEPSSPKILGSLKIPGYSDYLQPYDENHIIGFGKDTIEVPIKNPKGETINTQAYYMGMKIAIFDVTDVNNPVEMFTEKIGDRGTDSELLRNHKALLFDKDRNLLAFPVTVVENTVKEPLPNGVSSFPQYGQFSFQGAYVYNIDLKGGFGLKGRITHISGEEYRKAGNYWYNSDMNVERILYIGDNLYTLSKGMVKANQISDLKEKKYVIIP